MKSESLQKATIVGKKVIICIKKTQPASFKHYNTGTTKLSSHPNYLHLSTEFYYREFSHTIESLSKDAFERRTST